MRQDKDRSGKWLLAHHGDAILKLGGITGFSSWKALQSETVAPRRLPDGLIEIRFPGEPNSTLVLIEIETYPDAEVDRQILDDVMLIALDRKVVPEVISLVLKSKGNLAVLGTTNRTSIRGQTRVSGSWPVVRLWEQDAETLLAAGDAGLIPWVPLTRTTLPPEELLIRCRDRLATVSDPTDRTGLIAVTQILAGLAFPDKRFLDLFGGARTMIESPVLDEVKEILRKQYEAEARAAGHATGLAEGRAAGLATGLATGRAAGLAEGQAAGLATGLATGRAEGHLDAARKLTIDVLEARFGPVPADLQARVTSLTDLPRLESLVRVAATCPDLATFAAKL